MFPNVTFPTSTDLVNFTTDSDTTTSAVKITIPNSLIQERSVGSKYQYYIT